MCPLIWVIFFVSACLLASYRVRGGALGIHQGVAIHLAALWHSGGGGVQEETMLLFNSWLAFNHFLLYPQANWALLVLIPRWVGLCTF